jgi:carboxylesterase type B
MLHLKHVYVAFALLSGVHANQNPTASVSNGVLVGTKTSLYAATATVNKYLGIPYAQSPPLRYAEPSPAQNWTGERNASSFGDICIQQNGKRTVM